MDNKGNQNIGNNSNNNKQAGHNINEFNIYIPKAIVFYEADIKRIISIFSTQKDKISNLLDNFKKVNIEEKNTINNLSKEYFEYIKKYSLQYFSKIETFLKDEKNIDSVKLYSKTVTELQGKIIAWRNDYKEFERIIEQIYEYIATNSTKEENVNRDLISVFIHFMYWNCDIGKGA